MAPLDLDTTINKYLDIINDNILEPYLIEKEYALPTTTVWFFKTNGDKAEVDKSETALITKYDASDTDAILKIVQYSSSKAAITNSLITPAIATGTKIDDTMLSEYIDSDENGFIYYKNSDNKLYNLEKFKTANYATEDTTITITENDYYDYFVRYKILKYIKDNFLSSKRTDLTTKITTELRKNKTIVEKAIPTITAKITKILDLLQFINNNKFDKFEPLVNCLYYYYWMALVDYNQVYCSTQLTYFKNDSFKSSGDAFSAIEELDGATGFVSASNNIVEKVLILIFEALCRNYSGDADKYLYIIKNIFVNNTETKKLINGLLELYGKNSATDPQPLYFGEYDSRVSNVAIRASSGSLVNKDLYIHNIIVLDPAHKLSSTSPDTSSTTTGYLITAANNYTTIDLFNTAATPANVNVKAVKDRYSQDIIKAFIAAKTTAGIFSVKKAAIIAAITGSSPLNASTIAAIAAYYVTSSDPSTIQTEVLKYNNLLLSTSTDSSLINTLTTEVESLNSFSPSDITLNDTHFLMLNKNNNANQPYTNTIGINTITYNSTLYKLSAITTLFSASASPSINIITKKQDLEVHIEKIRVLYNLLKDDSNFATRLSSDIASIDINGTSAFNIGDFTLISAIDTKLEEIKGHLQIILEHYDKAIKLDEIETKLHTIPNVIKSSIGSSNVDTDIKNLSEFKKAIKASDVIYKDNIDKYKTKNNQLNNIVKSNLYNNIFLYITIVVLILICLGIIYINNHKESLKTQYSIMVITFLLLYYIIYTNLTINITEDFASKTDEDKTLADIHPDVQKYLLGLANSDKEYKESLKKEKNKYANYAKSSNSKVNNLELVLNDEFINAIKSKELVKFLILFTAICIVCFIVQTNVEDLTTTSIIFIILFIIILSIYFYNINLMTRTKHDNKYWNHRMTMK